MSAKSTTAPTEVAAPFDKLVLALSDAAYDCGSWDEDDNPEAYKDVLGRRDAAKAALLTAIDTAIEAERERCAGIAHEAFEYHEDIERVSNDDADRGAMLAAKLIESAIREGKS